MRAEGLAEPVGDIVVSCTGGTPGPSSPIQITVELNANLTSRILNTASSASEALLLFDEPQPDQVNMSNGFPYNGQVLGTPGIAAGASGSGNIYPGRQVCWRCERHDFRFDSDRLSNYSGRKSPPLA